MRRTRAEMHEFHAEKWARRRDYKCQCDHYGAAHAVTSRMPCEEPFCKCRAFEARPFQQIVSKALEGEAAK